MFKEKGGRKGEAIWNKEFGDNLDLVIEGIGKATEIYQNTDRAWLYINALGFLVGNRNGGSSYITHVCLSEEIEVVAGELKKTAISVQRREELERYKGALERVWGVIDDGLKNDWKGKLGLYWARFMINWL